MMLPEERIGRLEVNVENIKADISQIKIDLRETRHEIDNVKRSVNALELKMVDGFNSLKVDRMTDRVAGLLMGAAILGVMARGFGWL